MGVFGHGGDGLMLMVFQRCDHGRCVSLHLRRVFTGLGAYKLGAVITVMIVVR